MEALLPEGRGRRSKLVAEMQHNRRKTEGQNDGKTAKSEKAVGLNTPFAPISQSRGLNEKRKERRGERRVKEIAGMELECEDR